MHLGVRPFDYLFMQQRRSHPGSEVQFNRGNIQNPVILIQHQLLRDIEQLLERMEVGVPVSNQILNVQDVSQLLLLLT